MKTLSIIIPCYNEGKDIEKNLNKLTSYLNEKNFSYEVIAVNDGSKDNTKTVLSLIKGIKASGYDDNRGKGGAVKVGLQEATGDYVIFMDADLSTDLSAIDKAYDLLETNPFVVGSRHSKDAVIKIKQPFLRVFIGKCCRIIVKAMFRFGLKDTQCGFKAMHNDVAKLLASKQTATGFSFDVELLYIAKLHNIPFKEMGVIWSDDKGSTVSPFKSSLKFFKDLFGFKLHKKRYL